MSNKYEDLIKNARMNADCGEYMSPAEVTTLLNVVESTFGALVAENAKLADCANFYRLGFKPVKGAFGIEYRPTEQLLDDCGNTAIEAIKTPATSAFLAEVRAQARNELIDELESRFNEMTKTLPPELRSGAAGAAVFVSTFRKGVQS